MQAKYKLLTNHSPLLGNDNSSKPVPCYNPGHTLGTGNQELHSTLLLFGSILVLKKPGNRIQPLTLNTCGLPALRIKGPPAHVFLGLSSLQAEAQAKSYSKNTYIDLIVVAPKKGLLDLPNGSKESTSLNFMNLKSSQAINQVQLLEKNAGLRPAPMTQAQKQKT
ncbi:hypothetical protein DSO57_1016688 [Entomophthora muscae]|uniref:Uncharacterized protein n=1 Tax=Entomophthora muscae TaxID=34485 RepID=A0ACC2RJF5_9FUNG|nr:hypothetical protein DSO57_1016688 [Entomophthora muscae]